MDLSFLHEQIASLKEIMDRRCLTQDEAESLYEYEGRLQSIEAEIAYLNGEDGRYGYDF